MNKFTIVVYILPYFNLPKLILYLLVPSRFLDVAGMKNSKAYLVNGVAMVVTWLVSTTTICL